jgi:hypothetical protein
MKTKEQGVIVPGEVLFLTTREERAMNFQRHCDYCDKSSQGRRLQVLELYAWMPHVDDEADKCNGATSTSSSKKMNSKSQNV